MHASHAMRELRLRIQAVLGCACKVWESHACRVTQCRGVVQIRDNLTGCQSPLLAPIVKIRLLAIVAVS